ncbi:MAG: protein kinase domain-containing protein [Kofleriaceae bacterium]
MREGVPTDDKDPRFAATLQPDPGSAATAVPNTAGGTMLSEAAPARIIVRAPSREDYTDLVAVDPAHYARGEQLARGGMGRISIARDRRLGRTVALKELLTPSASLRTRFEREARITARLQHPSIVNLIEAGVWPNGEPFYAMKLVEGESIDRAVARCPTLALRLALLASVIAAVDAMAYAHSLQIVHRDLKPQNILIGEFGETVVIDWGLAKDLAELHGANEQGDPFRTASSTDTVAGSVMGTPAYMPPEQARGEIVGARADVYALGAILYHLLGGRAPYHGSTSSDTLDQVLAGPPPSIESLQPRLANDLVTIVAKAMARDPDARYATARELAEDLRRFQTGQLVAAHRYSMVERMRRWVGRHRAVVAIGSILVVLLAVVSTLSILRIVHERNLADAQRELAEERRTRAERQRAAGEKLVDFQLIELKKRLEPIGRLDLLDGIGDSVLAYYDAVGTLDDAEDADALDRRLQALFVLIDVERGRGNLDGAMRLARVALGRSEHLVAISPHDVMHQRRPVGAHKRIGDLHYAALSLDQAVTEYELALAGAERNAERSTELQDQRNVATVHEAIGKVKHERGDLPGALAAFRDSVTRKEAVLARKPDDVGLQIGLAEACALAATVTYAQLDYTGSLLFLVRARELAESATRAAPDDNDAWIILGQIHGLSGDVHMATGALGDAETSYVHAANTLAARSAVDPDNAVVANEAALARGPLATVLEQLGRDADARRHLEAAVAMRANLVVRHPDNTTFHRSHATSLERLGAFERRRDNLEAAENRLAEALAILDNLVRSTPDHSEVQRVRARLIGQLGDVDLVRKRIPAALERYRLARALTLALVAKDPTSPVWQRNVLGTHQKVGFAQLAAGRYDEARAAFGGALVLAEIIASVQPDSVEALDDLANARFGLGEAARATGDPAALAHYREALRHRERILAKSPDSPMARQAVAEARQRVRDVAK